VFLVESRWGIDIIRQERKAAFYQRQQFGTSYSGRRAIEERSRINTSQRPVAFHVTISDRTDWHDLA
jgi:hypothetical protein